MAQVVVIEDEPTATTGGAPETTLPDPAITSQSSPQRSPQRAEQLHQEGMVISSDSSSASTTPPRADPRQGSVLR